MFVLTRKRLAFEKLKSAVEDAGYGLLEEQQTKKVELSIEGMTLCSMFGGG